MAYYIKLQKSNRDIQIISIMKL